MTDSQTDRAYHCLARAQAGDDAARDELLQLTRQRLTALTRVMFKDFPGLRRWVEADDVFQNATLRLHRSLEKVTLQSLREYYRLAARQIRRELIDLVRHYYGPQGIGANHESWNRPTSDDARPGPEPQGSTLEPERLAVWSEFHQHVERLTDEEREAFELLWYQGLTHAQAAEVLEVSTKTVQRRWKDACLSLRQALRGELPGR